MLLNVYFVCTNRKIILSISLTFAWHSLHPYPAAQPVGVRDDIKPVTTERVKPPTDGVRWWIALHNKLLAAGSSKPKGIIHAQIVCFVSSVLSCSFF